MVALSMEDERTRGGTDRLEQLARQARSARTAIFQAKLRPSVNPAHLLPRPRLHALVEESVEPVLGVLHLAPDLVDARGARIHLGQVVDLVRRFDSPGR